ncbi:hypothetical protein OH77DRAFT_1432614 [Trametes cingulata]|nr:hypothetical protein OH77DRAFT_1432614 [Trametes cingulata]
MEYAVAPIALYSDSTHLTNFGVASLYAAACAARDSLLFQQYPELGRILLAIG